jgi:endonuclease G
LNILLAALISLTLLLPVTVATAAPTACPEQYYDRQAPDLVNQKLAAKTKEICYSEYGVLHSGVTRTPLYAGEHLTSDQIQQAKVMVRNSKFFPEPRLPRAERSELRYYTRSGYDRGHMAPSGDMPTESSQQECFSLANIVPQNPKNNRGVWEGIETAVRNIARDRGEIYVVTGTVFSGDNIQRIGGAVMVPTRLFKAVYDPHRQQAGVYLVDNAAGAQPQMISLAELAQVSGIDAFPSVSDEVKAEAMPLPSPKSYKERKRRGGH